MTSAENKKILQHAFSELSKGNSKPFVDSWAEDLCFTIIGSTKWSRTYRGKRAVLKELMEPLFSNFADQYTSTAHRFIAENDHVVVECRGHVTTKSGKPYHNTYCYICRMAEGKIKELTEYSDTALIEAVLDDPA